LKKPRWCQARLLRVGTSGAGERANAHPMRILNSRIAPWFPSFNFSRYSALSRAKRSESLIAAAIFTVIRKVVARMPIGIIPLHLDRHSDFCGVSDSQPLAVQPRVSHIFPDRRRGWVCEKREQANHNNQSLHDKLLLRSRGPNRPDHAGDSLRNVIIPDPCSLRCEKARRQASTARGARRRISHVVTLTGGKSKIATCSGLSSARLRHTTSAQHAHICHLAPALAGAFLRGCSKATCLRQSVECRSFNPLRPRASSTLVSQIDCLFTARGDSATISARVEHWDGSTRT
jgi:hypothetical protein